MDTHHVGQNRIRARRTYCTWLLVGALAALVGLADSASAGLILNTLRYDGHVRDNGANTGVEKHFGDYRPAGLSTPSSFKSLPAVPPDPAPPLSAALDLQLNSYLQTTGGLGTTPYVEIWINKVLPGSLFANPLDTMLAAPIELEVELYMDNLPDGEKLVFPHIGAEQFGSFPPHPAPVSVMVSNDRGSQDDPLHVLIGLSADQADVTGVTGQAKVRLYFDTMQVPEPASLTLIGLGVVGLLGLARRRRLGS